MVKNSEYAEQNKIEINPCFVIYIVYIAHNQPAETTPKFLAPLENLTVTQGRDVSFTCVVNELGLFKVSNVKMCLTKVYIRDTHTHT